MCYRIFNTIEIWLKRYPIQIALSAFVISLVLYIIFPKWFSISLVIAFFGSIFVALKYKLDQANYHKDLFEKRYECVLVMQCALSKFIKHAVVTKEMILEINVVMQKSYFLFSDSTYQSIDRIRECLIAIKDNPGNLENEKLTDQLQYLKYVIENNNFAKLFPELKIDTY